MAEKKHESSKAVAIGLGMLAVGGAAAWLAVRRVRTQRERRLWETKTVPSRLTSAIAPKPGDILLFFRPNRTRDYLIEWVTGSHFYHAALWAGANTVIEARPAGVVHNSLRGREGEYVIVPAPGRDERGTAAFAWAQTQLGSPFDRTDMLVIGLEHLFRHWRINYTRPGSYSCGELVAEAYFHAGVRLVPEKKPSETAPSDLARCLLPIG